MKRTTIHTTVAMILGLELTIGFVRPLGTGSIGTHEWSRSAYLPLILSTDRRSTAEGLVLWGE